MGSPHILGFEEVDLAAGRCGCGSTPASPTWALLLLTLAGLRRR
ncbi:MAG: hypothetical protein JRI25_08600 [Deltaproteobacteria bacterium]|nr:hypothetical protein [Deltaproteobacteria bacterium]